MQKAIEQIAEKFYRQLPKNEAYSAENLSESGFPDFLIQRLQTALRAKIREQIKLPSDDWLNAKAEEVQQTKQLFFNAVFDEARLPAERAKPLIETSVSDVVKILVQPRKNISEILYVDKTVLTTKELEKRVQRITAYRHFAQVLTGYMKRKKRQELKKEQCKKIVADVDEKLTKSYSPPQWAQLLDPLFTLTDGQIHSHLLRLFFEDKKMARKAKAFESTDETVNRAEFIEVLTMKSSKEINQRQLTINKKPESKKNVAFTPPVAVAEEETEKAEGSKSYQDKDSLDKAESAKSKTDQKHQTETNHIEKKNIDSSPTVNKAFNQAPDEEHKSLNDFFAARQVEQQKAGNRRQETGNSSSEKTTKKTDESYEKAIWQRFAESDEKTSDTENTKQEKSGQSDHHKKQLKQQLKDKEQFFVKELFDGSKSNYEMSISKIAEKNSWEQAVKTIQNDIFEKNDVNIYSPAAVGFIDRLQDYFTRQTAEGRRQT